MLHIFLLCLARACCWQPVLPLSFRAFFGNVFYITRKAAKNDGAADAAQVTCTCLGENGPFFRAFCTLSFALPLLAGSLAGFGAGKTQREEVLAAWVQRRGLWPPPRTALRRVKRCQEQTQGLLDTNVPLVRKQIYMCFSLPGRPFLGDIIFLLVCLVSPWRQHYTVIEAQDKRPAIPVW